MYQSHSNKRAVSLTGKVAGVLAVGAMACIGLMSVGCETSHTETDKPGLFGGHVHEETTTTHNPVTNTDDTTKTETKTP